VKAPRAIPYVVGQWVRGEKFYGRNELITEILDGHRNSIWLLGARRVGKTSLLKQVEHLTASGDRGVLALFWDLQGADDPAELHLSFWDALLDAEDRLGEVGVALAELPSDDLFAAMAEVRRRLRARGLSLLLLCDEVEELLNLDRQDPALLRKLRRALQSREGVRSVLASSVRLCALAEQRGDTSPFLHGFSPPLYIHGLSDEESRQLIRQDRLPEELRPTIAAAEVEAIRSRCDNHPYLIQLVCKRHLELGDLEEACEQVATDRMVSYFFSVDFELLFESERAILRFLAGHRAADSNSIRAALQLEPAGYAADLQRLEQLGFIRRSHDRRYGLSSYFLRRWLDDLTAESGSQRRSLTPSPVGGPSQSAITQSLEIVAGRYALLEQLGSGAAGTVFKAWDSLLQTQVALKRLRSGVSRGPNALERVRQEILLPRNVAHPNIVRVYDLGTEEGGIYLTMQWVEGRTLEQLIADEAPLSPATAVEIARKIASALAAAHRHKVLHRDVKPGNILMSTDGEPHLADFGLARLIGGPAITSHGMFVGTPSYASPEQAAVEDLDVRSDLYSLGIVLFEMVTGRLPFAADSAAEVLEMQRSAPAPDPKVVRPEVPAPLSEVILRCLEKDPEDRFDTAGDLEAALRSAAERLPELRN
jgi:DNA-binding MarR family transcriptional regulator